MFAKIFPVKNPGKKFDSFLEAYKGVVCSGYLESFFQTKNPGEKSDSFLELNIANTVFCFFCFLFNIPFAFYIYFFSILAELWFLF